MRRLELDSPRYQNCLYDFSPVYHITTSSTPVKHSRQIAPSNLFLLVVCSEYACIYPDTSEMIWCVFQGTPTQRPVSSKIRGSVKKEYSAIMRYLDTILAGLGRISFAPSKPHSISCTPLVHPWSSLLPRILFRFQKAENLKIM